MYGEIRPSNLPLKYSPGSRPLKMEDPGMGPWEWRANTLQNSENFALQKPFFTQNMYKSWRKRHQNSYGDFKFGVKI